MKPHCQLLLNFLLLVLDSVLVEADDVTMPIGDQRRSLV